MNKKYFGELFSGIVIAFIIITAIACTIKFGINNNKSIATLTPEDKRAMTYNLVTDE